MTSRRIFVAVALWLLAPVAAAAQLAAPLDQVPRLFAAGSYDQAGALALGALAEAELAVDPRQRAMRAGQLVQAWADNRRLVEAGLRVAQNREQQAFNLAQIAVAAAIDGDGTAARHYLAEAIAAAGQTPDGYGAAAIAEAQARLGEQDRALETARTNSNRLARALALARVALAGPTGRPDGAPEEAYAEVRGWNASLAQNVGPAPYILASLARAMVRHGDGNGALDRAASIEDVQWRATAFAWAASELAAWQLPGLANQGLRRAEETMGFDRAAAPAAIAQRVPAMPLTWLAYAYGRMGEREQAQRAMEALLLIAAGAAKEPVRRMEALAFAANAIGRTRQHVAEAEARAREVAPPPPRVK